MKNIYIKINDLSLKAACLLEAFLSSKTFLFLLGLGLLSFGLSDLAQAQVSVTLPDVGNDIGEEQFNFARCRFLRLLEGSFGALLAVAAGIGSIIAASVGKYAVSYTFLAVSVGSFCMRSFVSLFFGDVGTECGP